MKIIPKRQGSGAIATEPALPYRMRANDLTITALCVGWQGNWFIEVTIGSQGAGKRRVFFLELISRFIEGDNFYRHILV